jgi:LDH2 family malate/lactate/ureidoglycolate dehydrogenase
MPTFPHEALADFSERILTAAGMRMDHAQLVAALLSKADLRGYPAHGIAHLPAYLEHVRNGLIDITAVPEVVREGPSHARIDGHFAFGQVVGYQAMQLAIEKGRNAGMAIVVATRSGHLGRLADYVEMAAGAGLIGMAMLSLSSSSIPAYGGMSGVAGTNPVAYGIPSREGDPFILDFATAALSRGELGRRAALGQPIPDGVLLDGQGQPTTTFRGGAEGSILLPFGGYKGSGLHLVTELLAGILSGHGLGRDWSPRAPGGSINAAYFQVIDPELFRPRDEFLAEVDEFLRFVRASQPQPGVERVLVPGDRARETEAKQRAAGITLDETEWVRLMKWATELGVTAPQPSSEVS